MKLSEWAKQEGVSYKTARAWFHAGTLPVSAYQNPKTKTIVVENQPQASGKVVGYARVSSHDQADDLERQVARLAMSGCGAAEYVTEIGSALNSKRPKLLKILSDPEVSTIVVEHRDRLMHCGVVFLEAALSARGALIIVLDENTRDPA